MSTLHQLSSLAVRSHTWNESVSLVRAVGAKLTTFDLSLIGSRSENELYSPEISSYPYFEDILEMCPNLKRLVISFGVISLKFRSSEEEEEDDGTMYPKLTHVIVHGHITQRSLELIWRKCRNLKQ